MVVKAWPPEPLIYAGIVAALLLFRLWLYVRKQAGIAKTRERRTPVRA